MLNLILGLLLAVVIMVAGFTCGHNLAFYTFFNSAEEFSQFVESALGNISLTADSGTANCNRVIDIFVDTGSSFSVNGYQLVIDTRDSKTLR